MDTTIGNVKLNYDYYPGEDFYSDGDIEDELLDIVKNHTEKDFNRIIAEKKSWPVLYHLSHIRGNILSALTWKGDESVLEIGSGCGAITGTLAKSAGYVKCIELSRRRSTINAYRNSEFDNIEIMVGNFQDVEKNLTDQFDVVTLIGVFEYASCYIHTDNPYEDFLNMVMKHVKKGGRLIIAIENRFGLKYWAGCKEDHLSSYFSGLEGYSESDGVRTLSKYEWEELLRNCGINSYRFYYPYPDYKLPMKIYSDDYLPKKGELNNNICNFDRERMVLFDEKKVFDMLIEQNKFPEYSNSFLIEIEK